ncbi:hypothetical protein Bca4012_103157 [Brassica carinata]
MKHHSRWAGLLADSAPADFRGYVFRPESREPSKSLNASCAPSLLARARLPGCHKSPPPSSRGYGTEAGLRVLPHALAKIRAKGARSASTCGGEFKPRNIAGRSGPKLSMTQSPQRDPSNGERTEEPSLKIGRLGARIVVREAPQRRTGPKFLERGAREGESPSCRTLSHHAGAVYESGCLGMQPQSGGKFRPRLNMGETDSEQVPRGKDEKDFEKRVKECLKLSGGKRMGRRCAPVGCERSNPSADRFGRGPTRIKAVA